MASQACSLGRDSVHSQWFGGLQPRTWPPPDSIVEMELRTDVSTRPEMPRGACSSSKHGHRQAWPQRTQIRNRQPKRWALSTVLEPAIEHTRPGAEQRARTTVITIVAAAQNGSSGVLTVRKHPRRRAVRGTQ
jgi:hypothetical protein